MGADGTVSANKNTIKIIGEETAFDVKDILYMTGKKSGSKTVSHLRLVPEKNSCDYLVSAANLLDAINLALLLNWTF